MSGSAQVGKKHTLVDAKAVFDIPVLFQVRADNEQQAAKYLADVLVDAHIGGGYDVQANEVEVESWFLPNHKMADRNDIPVSVMVIEDSEGMRKRRALVEQIEDTLEGRR